MVLNGESPELTFEDVESALEEWTQAPSRGIFGGKHMLKCIPFSHGPAINSLCLIYPDPRTNVSCLIPEYYLRYTRFCLHTHFVRHITSTRLSAKDESAVIRCVSAAREVLSLSDRLGPLARYQLRYYNGFLAVMIYLCCSFMLKAFSAFPQTVQDVSGELEQIREIATLLTDLGPGNNGSSAFDAGKILIKRVDQMSLLTETFPPTRYETLGSLSEATGGLDFDYGQTNLLGMETLDFDLLFSI